MKMTAPKKPSSVTRFSETCSVATFDGEPASVLTDLSEKTFEDHRDVPGAWLLPLWKNGSTNTATAIRRLKPSSRSDQGHSRRLSEEIEQLGVDLKREDPGRSAPLILRTGTRRRINRGKQASIPSNASCAAVVYPAPEWNWNAPARFRWQLPCVASLASRCAARPGVDQSNHGTASTRHYLWPSGRSQPHHSLSRSRIRRNRTPFSHSPA